MWLATTRGFYSVVAHRHRPGRVIVRARVQRDLERLLELTAESAGIHHTPRAGYPYRVELDQGEWSAMAARLASEIDYGNFKDAVSARQSAERAHVYLTVWSALRGLEHLSPGE